MCGDRGPALGEAEFEMLKQKVLEAAVNIFVDDMTTADEGALKTARERPRESLENIMLGLGLGGLGVLESINKSTLFHKVTSEIRSR